MSALDWGRHRKREGIAYRSGPICEGCHHLWPCDVVEAYWAGRQAAARDLLGVVGSLDAVLDRAEDIATGRELRSTDG